MRTMLLLLVLLTFCGCVRLSDPEIISGYEYAGYISGVDTFMNYSTYNAILQADVYYKNNGNKPVDDILLKMNKRLTGRWVWNCAGSDIEDYERTITFGLDHRFDEDLKAVLEEKGLKVHRRYAVVDKFTGCKGKVFSSRAYMHPTQEKIAAICKDCFEELQADIVGTTFTSSFMGLKVACDESFVESIINIADYTRDNLHFIEKLMLLYDSKVAPTSGATMTVRKSIQKAIPESGDTSTDVIKSSWVEINGKKFRKQIKIYEDGCRSLLYLGRLGLDFDAAALGIEYSGYMDASMTSEIIIGYYMAVDEEAVEDILDGNMTQAEKQLVERLLSESEQKMKFIL